MALRPRRFRCLTAAGLLAALIAPGALFAQEPPRPGVRRDLASPPPRTPPPTAVPSLRPAVAPRPAAAAPQPTAVAQQPSVVLPPPASAGPALPPPAAPSTDGPTRPAVPPPPPPGFSPPAAGTAPPPAGGVPGAAPAPPVGPAPLVGPMRAEAADPTVPGPEIRSLLEGGGPAKPAAAKPSAPTLPEMQLKGRIIAPRRRPVALVEIGGRVFTLRAGMDLFVPGGRGQGAPLRLKVLEVDPTEVRFEVEGLSQTFSLN